MPLSIDELDQLDMGEFLNELGIDIGVITHGACDTPEAQARFDAEQMGKPPAVEKS